MRTPAGALVLWALIALALMMQVNDLNVYDVATMVAERISSGV